MRNKIIIAFRAISVFFAFGAIIFCILTAIFSLIETNELTIYLAQTYAILMIISTFLWLTSKIIEKWFGQY